MTRQAFVVTGQSYQEKLTRRHCVAGMEARLERELPAQEGADHIVVKAYFRFRQRWETIGRISDAHLSSLSQKMAVQGALPVTISRVTPRRDGYPEIIIEIKQQAAMLPGQVGTRLGAEGAA